MPVNPLEFNRIACDEEAFQFSAPWRRQWNAGESCQVRTLRIEPFGNKTFGSREGVDEVEEEQMMTLVRRDNVLNRPGDSGGSIP